MDFQVRKLQTKDLYALVAILGKCGKEAVSEIAKIMVSPSETPKVPDDGAEKIQVVSSETPKEVQSSTRNSSVGLAILSTLLTYAESDIKPFFASLVDKTAKEFDELPFDTTLVIIEELGKAEDLPNFFKRVLSLTSIFSTEK